MDDQTKSKQADQTLDQGQIDALMTMAKFDTDQQGGPKAVFWTRKKIFWLFVIISSILSLFLL